MIQLTYKQPINLFLNNPLSPHAIPKTADFVKHRWPTTPTCVRCSSSDCSYDAKLSIPKVVCHRCYYKFSPKHGTIFANSNISLDIWFMAMRQSTKLGVTAQLMSEGFDISLPTARNMLAKMRLMQQCESFFI